MRFDRQDGQQRLSVGLADAVRWQHIDAPDLGRDVDARERAFHEGLESGLVEAFPLLQNHEGDRHLAEIIAAYGTWTYVILFAIVFLETGLVADLSIIKAEKADTQGNLIFNKTARNFNPPMAMAGKVTVAEVEEIVPTGDLDPDHIHLPGVFVQRIIKGTFEKRIEQRTVRKREAF